MTFSIGRNLNYQISNHAVMLRQAPIDNDKNFKRWYFLLFLSLLLILNPIINAFISDQCLFYFLVVVA